MRKFEDAWATVGSLCFQRCCQPCSLLFCSQAFPEAYVLKILRCFCAPEAHAGLFFPKQCKPFKYIGFSGTLGALVGCSWPLLERSGALVGHSDARACTRNFQSNVNHSHTLLLYVQTNRTPPVCSFEHHSLALYTQIQLFLLILG